MTLVQIRTSARDVILSMKKLLAERHECRISRKTFLRKWGKLRERLAATHEYQAWRQRVIERDGGQCTTCAEPTRMVHHRKPVAWFPDLVLEVDNGELQCTRCHKRIHKQKCKVA